MRALTSLLIVAAFTASITHAETIRAVTEATPYTYLKDGKVAGPATELVELTLKRSGFTAYRTSLYPWARSYDMALHEPNVLIYLIARTPARESQFKWVGEIMKIQYHLYKLKDRQDIVIKNLQDAKNYTIGAMRDDVRYRYLEMQGFTKLVISSESIDNFNKLLNRRVDLIPLVEREAGTMCEAAHFDCANLEKVLTLHEVSTGLYMAYSKSTPDRVVERTRAGFEKIKGEGGVRKIMGDNP
jgi:polar amino acid transport system substrate-binding protein